MVAGAFALLYVFIIGGQAWPLEIFPGFEARSSFGDGQIAAYAPRLPELLLGVAGVGHRLPHHGGRRAGAAVHARRTTSPARRSRGGRLMVNAANPRRLLVSATHKSSGKTTISVGLCAALRERGLKVQPFKKGPDYIDPMWLTVASGARCRNLDPYLSDNAEYRGTFRRHAAAADISIVEGNKGLYDGLALDGSNSNAALAKVLGLPVILVIDARGMTRGIAPLILGYQAFDRDVRIAGVILNNLGGSRHEAKLRLVIEHYTDVRVLGAVHCDPRLAIVERHLGLMPSNEADGAAAARGRDRVDRRPAGRSRRRAADRRRRGAADGRRRRARRPLSAGRASRRPHRRRAGPRVRLLLRRRPRRAARGRARRSSASTRWPMRSCPTSTGCSSAAAFPSCSPRELEANASLRAKIRARDRSRTARVRGVRRAHVPRPHADAATDRRSGWSARFPATS